MGGGALEVGGTRQRLLRRFNLGIGGSMRGGLRHLLNLGGVVGKKKALVARNNQVYSKKVRMAHRETHGPLTRTSKREKGGGGGGKYSKTLQRPRN